MAPKSYPKPDGYVGSGPDCEVLATAFGRLGLNPNDDDVTHEDIINRRNVRKGFAS